MDETYVVKKMLRTVSSKFIQIASTIEEFGDVNSKTIEEVIGTLKAHEERLRGHEQKSEEKVLLIRTNSRNISEGSSSRQFSTRESKFTPGRGKGRGRGRGRGRVQSSGG